MDPKDIYIDHSKKQQNQQQVVEHQVEQALKPAMPSRTDLSLMLSQFRRRFMLIMGAAVLVLLVSGSLFLYANLDKANSQAGTAAISAKDLVFQPNLPSAAVKGALAIGVPTSFTEGITFNKTAVFNNGLTIAGGNLQLGNVILNPATFVTSLKAGTGLSLAGRNALTITNTDPGSAQNIFKTITVGSTSFSAGSNNDTLTFAAGSGINLSTDTTNKKITISANSSNNTWTLSGTLLYPSTMTDYVGIGTSAPAYPLDVTGTTNITGNLLLSGTTELNGITYSWPSTDGSNGDVLSTNGSGTLSWTAITGGGSGTISGIGDVFSGDAFTATGSAGTSLYFANSGHHGDLTIGTISSDQTYTLPNQSGTLCLSSGNCAGTGAGIGGSGTTNYLAKFSSTYNLTQSSIYDNGNIGIGTTNPNSLLTVAGSISGSGSNASIDIASPNLVMDGGFESWSNGTTSMPDGWNLGGGTAGITQNTNPVYITDGTYSLDATTYTSNAYIYSDPLPTLKAGHTYILTLYIEDGGGGRVGFWNGSTLDASYTFSGYTSMKKVELPYTVGSTDQTNERVFIQRTYASVPIYVDSVSVTEGTIAPNFAYKPILDTGSQTLFGNLGIGTTSPNGLLDVEGAPTGKALMTLNETGNQNIFTASVSGTTKFVIDNNGNVGIGTANPSQPLYVSGNAELGYNPYLYWTGNNLNLSTQSNLIPIINFHGSSSYPSEFNMLTAGDSSIGVQLNAAGASYFINGVGIYTSTPTTLLANTATNIADEVGTDVNSVGLTWSTNNGGYSEGLTNLSGQTTANGLLVSIAGITNTNRILTLNSNGIDKFVVTGTGNVGIGTTSPTDFSLETAGDIGPNATDTYNLGSSNLEWNNVYAKNLTVSGNLTTTGTQAGFWQRNSGNLAPLNTTDNLLVGGADSTSAYIQLAGTSPTTATGAAFMFNNLTSGTGMSLSSNSTTNTSGNLMSLSTNGTFTTANQTVSSSLLSAVRNLISNTVSNAVTFDSEAGAHSYGYCTFTWNHTVSNYQNRLLLVQVSGFYTNVSSVSYNGVALTEIKSTSPGGTPTSTIWEMVNPPVGTYTVSVTNANNCTSIGMSTSWYNVNQSTPVGSIASTQGNGTSASVSTTTTANQLITDFVSDNAGSYFSSDPYTDPGTGQTVIGKDFGTYGYDGAAASKKASSGTTTSMSWTFISSRGWIDTEIPINQVPTGSPLSITGALATLSSNCTITGGYSCSDSSNILSLSQQYSGSLGDVLSVTGAGAGNLGTFSTTNSGANGLSVGLNSSSVNQYALNLTGNSGNTNILYAGANGNIGIGTTSPVEPVEISKNASDLLKLSSTSGGVGNHAYIDFTTYGGSGINARIGAIDMNSYNGGLVFEVGNTGSANGTTTTEAMRITNAGYIGMGTTSPFSLLSNTSSNILDQTGAGTSPGGSITWSLNTAGYVQGLTNLSTASNANGLLIRTTGTANTNRILTLNSNGTDEFVVTGAGNVGIGTTTPGALLDVAGNATMSGNLTFYGSNPTIAATNMAPLNLGGLTTGSVNITTAGALGTPFIVDYSGNVGIGTTTTSNKLTLSGGLTVGPPTLSGYAYRAPITINNTGNTNKLSNYQVAVTVDTASLITAGKLQSACQDIRFTDSDMSSQLPYWIESGCNTSTTKIWIKVPSIPASSNKTIYMYYGNSGATAGSSASSTFVTTVPDLYASYTMDEASGSTVADNSGDGLSATATGTTIVSGEYGNARSFNGTSDYIAGPTGNFANFTAGMTIAVWAYPTSNTAWQRFTDIGNGPSSDNILFARDNNGYLHFEVYNGATSGGAITANVINLNQWQMFVATEDNTGHVTLYKNGVQVATGTTAVPNNLARNNVYIGRSNWSSDPYYSGYMDQLQVFNTALTANQVSQLYSNYGYATTNDANTDYVRAYSAPEPTTSVGTETNTPTMATSLYVDNASGDVALGTTTTQGLLNISGAPIGQALVNLNYTGTDQNIFTASSSGATQFVIDHSGNIGIGTGGSLSQKLYVHSGNMALDPTGYLMFNGQSDLNWRMGYNTGSYTHSLATTPLDVVVGQGTNDGFTVGQTGGTSILELKGSNKQAYFAGNVGIQTTSNTYPLQIGTNNTNGNGAYVSAGGAWTNGSSKTFKEDFQVLNQQDILSKIVSLPIDEWSYKVEGPGVRHIGPFAEDFYSTFGVGNDPQHISTIDPAGVALVGIQALNSNFNSLSSVIASNSEAISKLNVILSGSEGSLANASTSNELSDSSLSVQNDITTLQQTQASHSAAIQTLTKSVNLNSDTMASISAQLNQIKNLDFESFFASSAAYTKVTTAEFDFGKVNADLTVMGSTTLNDLAAQSISIGNEMQIGASSLNTLTQTLQIQPLKQQPISIMADAIHVNTDGTVAFAQNVSFAKDITVGGDVKSASITTQEVNIAHGNITTLSDTESVASGSAGTLVLKAGQTTQTVFSNLLAPGALVYITPVSDTQGEAPYISDQTSTQSSASAYFRVKIAAPVTKDIRFNYLIIGQK